MRTDGFCYKVGTTDSVRMAEMTASDQGGT